MSNYFAIATVTAAISYLLKEGFKNLPDTEDTEIRNVIKDTEISIKPPDAGAGSLEKRLNIFLYQVNPNIGYSNMDLPTHNFNGELVKSPKLALNLHYLLTAYSDGNDELIAHQILAKAMMILNENPILKRETIRITISANNNIKGSDL